MNHEPLPLRLGVNVDHVATLREARGTRYPSPLSAALVAQAAGADSITVHLREDRRHIQERDVQDMLTSLSVPLNLELAATEDMLSFASKMAPPACCLVPERREELTTEGGLNVVAAVDEIRTAVTRLADSGARVALFVDPEPEQLEAAIKTGAVAVEIHTGAYADATDESARAEELARIAAFAAAASGAGLSVHAGHGLTLSNTPQIATIEQIQELNIGHSIVADAVIMGMAAAVARMKNTMIQARLAPRPSQAPSFSAL